VGGRRAGGNAAARLLARALLTAFIALLAAAPAAASRAVDLGDSVNGRDIVAYEVGSAHARTRVLVVGCIHGNEPAGIAIARAAARLRLPRGVALWVIPDLNPDGVAARTRQNAHNVDLNRNFPTGWYLQTGVYNSGPRPLSEPESRIANELILRFRPTVSIWFHQHEDVVDDSSGSIALERRFAAIAGLPLQPLPRYGGSAVTWESARFPGSSPFVVELPPGMAAPPAVARYLRALLAIAR
jgi:protein MpaA